MKLRNVYNFMVSPPSECEWRYCCDIGLFQTKGARLIVKTYAELLVYLFYPVTTGIKKKNCVKT